MSFAELGLSPALLAVVRAKGYSTPTPVQAQAIPAILAGRDVLASAQTGTGKTAAFALPLLHRLAAEPAAQAPRALVLVPTRELAEQVADSIATYGASLDLRVLAVFGGVSLAPQQAALREGVDILVATPGRLLELLRQQALSLSAVTLRVLDEADRMLDLGFARDLARIFDALPAVGQTLLFSATFSGPIRQLAQTTLRKPLTLEATPRNTAARTVRQWVVPVDKKRKSALFLFMRKDRGWSQVLVFVKTKRGADELAAYLQSKQIAAEALHGDRDQGARLQTLAAFKAGTIAVLVATDVAARGLDIAGLPVVVNFDLPTVAEDYVHRIGRTGRAGQAGQAVSLVSADEAPQLAAIEALLRRPLSRDEEPGFEPVHQLPMLRAVLAPPKKPATTSPPRTRTPKAAGQAGSRAVGSKAHTGGHPGATARKSGGLVRSTARPGQKSARKSGPR